MEKSFNGKTIVVFSGKKFSGKTTVAAKYFSDRGYQKIALADPIKNILKCLNIDDEYIYGSKKEVPLDILNGKTSRHAQQIIGTEWFREEFGDNIWVNRLISEIGSSPHDKFVIDDLRFRNEYDILIQYTDNIYFIDRQIDDEVSINKDLHSSETSIDSFKHLLKQIDNNSTLDNVNTQLKEIYDSLHLQRQ